jgi:hypothetical protein
VWRLVQGRRLLRWEAIVLLVAYPATVALLATDRRRPAAIRWLRLKHQANGAGRSKVGEMSCSKPLRPDVNQTTSKPSTG